MFKKINKRTIKLNKKECLWFSSEAFSFIPSPTHSLIYKDLSPLRVKRCAKHYGHTSKHEMP